MSPRTRLAVLSLLLLAAACGRDAGQGASVADEAGTPVPAAATEESERIWAGLLPCSDCQGIDTRLVLRTDRGRRNYVLTETYLGGSGKTSFNRAGTWTQLERKVGGEPQTTYVLDPGQATQRFALQPDGALELLDAQGKTPEDAIAYRLQRL